MNLKLSCIYSTEFCPDVTCFYSLKSWLITLLHASENCFYISWVHKALKFNNNNKNNTSPGLNDTGLSARLGWTNTTYNIGVVVNSLTHPCLESLTTGLGAAAGRHVQCEDPTQGPVERFRVRKFSQTLVAGVAMFSLRSPEHEFLQRGGPSFCLVAQRSAPNPKVTINILPSSSLSHILTFILYAIWIFFSQFLYLVMVNFFLTGQIEGKIKQLPPSYWYKWIFEFSRWFNHGEGIGEGWVGFRLPLTFPKTPNVTQDP